MDGDIFIVEPSVSLPSGGKVIYVDQNVTNQNPNVGRGDGSSWNTAFAYLQDALSVATDGDEIWVAEGTYYPDVYTSYGWISGEGLSDLARVTLADTDQVSATFRPKVSMYGGFWGNETSRKPEGNPENTVLSGQISENRRCYNVITLSGMVDQEVNIDGFKITGGRANEGGGRGGGVLITHDTLKPKINFSNCIFEDNEAIYGGALSVVWSTSNDSTKPNFVNCVFVNNKASFGGALNLDHTCEFTNCVFAGNEATFGGAVYVNYKNTFERDGWFIPDELDFYFCTFSENNASDSGGAVYVWPESRHPGFSNCIIWNNRTNGKTAEPIFGAWNHDSPSKVKEESLGIAGAPPAYDLHFEAYEHPNVIQGGSVFPEHNHTHILDIDPQFLNPGNNKGVDGVWFTADDGFSLENNSTVIDQGKLWENHDYNGRRFSVNWEFVREFQGGTTFWPMDRADLDSDNNITETVPYDLKGDNRQQGRSVDLGAYESGQAKTQIPIEVIPPEGGAMIITGIPRTFVPGKSQQCTIMAVPRKGYILVGWSGGGDFGVQLTITITIRIGVPFVIKPIFAPVGGDTDGDGESDDDEIKKGGDPLLPKPLEPGLTVVIVGGQPTVWRQSPWFGYFWQTGLGWMYHYNLGWFYLHGYSDGIWCWFENYGWLWTSNASFPYFYGYTHKSWLFVEIRKTVRIYTYSQKVWQDFRN